MHNPAITFETVQHAARQALLGMAIRALALDASSNGDFVHSISLKVTEVDSTHPGIEVTYLDVHGVELAGHSL